MKFEERSIIFKSKQIFIALVSLDPCYPSPPGSRWTLKCVIQSGIWGCYQTSLCSMSLSWAGALSTGIGHCAFHLKCVPLPYLVNLFPNQWRCFRRLGNHEEVVPTNRSRSLALPAFSFCRCFMVQQNVNRSLPSHVYIAVTSFQDCNQTNVDCALWNYEQK